MKMKKEEPLTQEKKREIYKAIAEKTTPNDPPCDQVIREDFKGDEEAYLRKMAEWHKVPLD
jgi:hypothetical protein